MENFDRSHQLPHYNSTMEIQLGQPTVRNNLIIVNELPPYRADDEKHHVDQDNNWYYQVENPDTVYFPETAVGNGDPRLVKYVSGGLSDYHLSENSPFRCTGQNLSEYYTSDFEGNSLPAEGPWDIGALQYQDGCTE